MTNKRTGKSKSGRASLDTHPSQKREGWGTRNGNSKGKYRDLSTTAATPPSVEMT
jgi:hypothetical protein